MATPAFPNSAFGDTDRLIRVGLRNLLGFVNPHEGGELPCAVTLK